MPRQKKGPLGGFVPTIKLHSGRHTKLVTLQPDLLHDTARASVDAATANDIDMPLPGIAEENMDDDDEVITKYQQTKLNELAQWDNVRDGLLEAAVCEACPSVTSCVLCHADDAFVRCQDCGPTYLVCSQCANNDHQYRPLHTMEIFKDGLYQPFSMAAHPFLQRPDHINCVTACCRKLTVINDKGHIVDVLCMTCNCEPHAVTLRRYGLWPATPLEPQNAFTVGFLLWAEALLITGHVSVYHFVEAVRYRNRGTVRDFTWMYRLLIGETFDEFRHHLFKYRCQSDSIYTFGPDIICPACPKTADADQPLVMSLDGNFGLVHKRSAGKQTLMTSKHGNRLFVEDDIVSSFVSGYSSSGKSDDLECSHFRAEIISASQLQKLDVTGVFGCMCKHEIPWKVMNLQHGERFAYAVLMLQLLDSATIDIQSKFVLYDVACQLERHLLNVNQTELLSKFQLSVPAFHSYGHEASCQVTFGPRRIAGLGRVDGEALERFWSYLRHFAPITKQMTAAHRIDLLTDASIYYAHRKIDALGCSLVQRLTIACNEIKSCEEQLAKIKLESDVLFTESDIVKWTLLEQSRFSTRKRKHQSDHVPWQENYVTDLLELDCLQCSSFASYDRLKIEPASKYTRLLEKIQSTEKDHKLVSRWQRTDPAFLAHWHSLVNRRHQDLLKQVLDAARERQFLLEVKRRRAVGQKLSLRISKQIDRCSAQIRKIVRLYNSLRCEPPSPGGRPMQILEADAFDVTSALYADADLESVPETTVPVWLRSQVIDLHNRMERATEELHIVHSEMCHVYNFYREQHKSLSDNPETVNSGHRALQLQKLQSAERRCRDFFLKFRAHVNLIPLDTKELLKSPDEQLESEFVDDFLDNADFSDDDECDDE